MFLHMCTLNLFSASNHNSIFIFIQLYTACVIKLQMTTNSSTSCIFRLKKIIALNTVYWADTGLPGVKLMSWTKFGIDMPYLQCKLAGEFGQRWLSLEVHNVKACPMMSILEEEQDFEIMEEPLQNLSRSKTMGAMKNLVSYLDINHRI